MFRITTHPEVGIDMRIEGRLTADGIPDVLGLVESRGGRPCKIDLSGLTTVDSRCRDVLTRLGGGGHHLLNPSPYIARLLQENQA